MRRSAGFFLGLGITFLMASTSCLAAQDSEPIPAESEQSAAPLPEEGAAAQKPEPAPAEPDAEAEHRTKTAADVAPDWQGELDLITDLLIDGKPLEARAKADHLLETEDLPESIASRARALRDKADEKLAGSPLTGSEPKPAPRPKIEVPVKEESGEKSEKAVTTAKAQSFKIRVASVGGGFSEGVTGQLRVSETGLSFVPQGKSREDWAIRWQELAEARSDTGLWDAPYPLVLIERGGRKRYVVRLDQKGIYLPGAPLLTAITEGLRKKSPQQKTAEPETGG